MNKYGIVLLMLVSFLFACSSGTGNKNETKVDSLGNSAATEKKSANGLAALQGTRRQGCEVTTREPGAGRRACTSFAADG